MDFEQAWLRAKLVNGAIKIRSDATFWHSRLNHYRPPPAAALWVVEVEGWWDATGMADELAQSDESIRVLAPLSFDEALTKHIGEFGKGECSVWFSWFRLLVIVTLTT